MSHFAVYVFTKTNGRDVDELLAPYNEEMLVAPYIEYTRQGAIAKIRQQIEEYKNGKYAEFLANPEGYKANHTHCPDHIKYLEEDFPKKLNWTDDECYAEMAACYDDDMIDEDGNLYSIYNPNAKWDWYSIGGRWDGSLVTKDGTKTNEDLVSNIDWDKTDIPFAFVDPIGRWFERGKMGWWAIVTNETEMAEWERQFKEFITRIGDDVKVTVVDCHI